MPLRKPAPVRLVEIPHEPIVLPEPSPTLRRGIMDLTNETCRFPFGQVAPFQFCGALEADTRAGMPYCRFHARITYRKPGQQAEGFIGIKRGP